jgi:4'-phosphopantetheinyl transferase
MLNPFLIRPGPSSGLVLRENEVHVWLVQVNDERTSPADSEDLLSSVEQHRASRFKFETDRRRYITAHLALRSILSTYLNSPAQELQFESGPYGKPKLASIHAGNKFQFNLSHSHEVALIALTRGREIGVDIEYVKSDFPIHEVAENFFTPKEAAALTTLPGHLQRQAFFKCWTSKEALLKAKGTGLSGELDEVEIIRAGGQHVRVNANVPGWSLVELIACDGYEAALVSEGEPAEVHLYRWEP